MNPEKFAAAVAVAIFAAGLVGLVLQRMLPEKHTTGPSRDMIGAVVGLLTLLCALVSGLLIWTAYGVYAGQNIAIQTLASKVLQFDLALQDYGPEANPERAALRDRLGKTIDQVWNAKESDANFAANNFAAAIKVLRDPQKALGQLQPSTDQQKQALATAISTMDAIAQARLQMSFALSAPVSYPLLLTVVGWVVCLFCGFGLMSKASSMPVITLAVGAVAIASAVLLILDLSNPYLGVFRASSAPLEQVLAVMGKE
ncbi:MAG TPA: hypothetical protein VJY34_10150 [Roseiarcus sp.]|nr:hypothetical protein [Roseiarcus sp.]